MAIYYVDNLYSVKNTGISHKLIFAYFSYKCKLVWLYSMTQGGVKSCCICQTYYEVWINPSGALF